MNTNGNFPKYSRLIASSVDDRRQTADKPAETALERYPGVYADPRYFFHFHERNAG